MRTSLLVLVAICSLSLAGTAPANATDLNGMRGLCKGRPSCTEVPDTSGGGWVDFCIADDDSPCENLIMCPKNGGDCEVAYLQGDKKRRTGNFAVEGILTSRAN